MLSSAVNALAVNVSLLLPLYSAEKGILRSKWHQIHSIQRLIHALRAFLGGEKALKPQNLRRVSAEPPAAAAAPAAAEEDDWRPPSLPRPQPKRRAVTRERERALAATGRVRR